MITGMLKVHTNKQSPPPHRLKEHMSLTVTMVKPEQSTLHPTSSTIASNGLQVFPVNKQLTGKNLSLNTLLNHPQQKVTLSLLFQVTWPCAFLYPTAILPCAKNRVSPCSLVSSSCITDKASVLTDV